MFSAFSGRRKRQHCVLACAPAPAACAVAAAGCALVLGACSAPAPAPSTQTAALRTAPAAGLTPLGDANTELKTQRPAAPSQLVVADVRTGKHETFERVVFDLVGTGEPGWFIDFTDTPTQQGSGKTIQVSGTSVLNVNIDGTVLPFELNVPDPRLGTVSGQGGFVTEVVPAGTFEGRSQFFIGLKGPHAYSVQVLKEPTRLVIDILA
ncbi:AMIN-like domain-containing (lipo)protein [Corynebacterium lizhenjunii]|uniref:AMIN-like domain-containing (lipo)protein n=1 Tax=Corynebacterium lizhenjunii TaxID=2709394 RepID=UPI001FD17914|nr:hypothetical protein [Corynebacterium lizhenjunii]